MGYILKVWELEAHENSRRDLFVLRLNRDKFKYLAHRRRFMRKKGVDIGFPPELWWTSYIDLLQLDNKQSGI